MTADRAARFVFAPVKIDLQAVHSTAGIRDNRLFVFELARDCRRVDHKPVVLREEAVTENEDITISIDRRQLRRLA